MLQFKGQMSKIKMTTENVKRLQAGLIDQATTRIWSSETKKREFCDIVNGNQIAEGNSLVTGFFRHQRLVLMKLEQPQTKTKVDTQ
jgi:hypothetical protein